MLSRLLENEKELSVFEKTHEELKYLKVQKIRNEIPEVQCIAALHDGDWG